MCAILLLLFLYIPSQSHQIYFETYYNDPLESNNKMIGLSSDDSVTTENNRAIWSINQQLFISEEEEEDDNNNRNAIKMEKFKWPIGEVPYCFDDNFDEHDRAAVLSAMDIFLKETCVKFIPKKQEHVEHIKFYKSNAGCGASIGYRYNRSEPLDVTYSPFCLTLPGAIQHELLHVLGLLHEQSRPDRDEYITILWENIDPNYFQNFKKADYGMVDTFNLPYDYESLMHYPNNAFAKTNRNVTIISKLNPTMKLGQSDGPTFFDLEKIRKMYNCK